MCVSFVCAACACVVCVTPVCGVCMEPRRAQLSPWASRSPCAPTTQGTKHSPEPQGLALAQISSCHGAEAQPGVGEGTFSLRSPVMGPKPLWPVSSGTHRLPYSPMERTPLWLPAVCTGVPLEDICVPPSSWAGTTGAPVGILAATCPSPVSAEQPLTWPRVSAGQEERTVHCVVLKILHGK